MIKRLLLILCISYGSLHVAQAQGYTFFTAQNAETIQQNAIMPADSGVYFCMKKNATQSSLYWLKNNALTEVKSIGTQYDVVLSQNGTYGKQWFTYNNKALFVAYSQYTAGGAVFVTDGTTLGTDTVLTYKYGTNVNIAGMIGSDLYFSTTSLTPYQTVLYKTDFTKAGTSVVKTITKTNLNTNYIDNQKLYLSGYLKSGVSSYAVLYAYAADTTRLLLGQNFFPAKVINGNLYAYANGISFTRKNLTTNVVSSVYIPDTQEGDRIIHVDQVLGIQNNKLFIQVNLAGPNNIANRRIYAGDISAATGTINFSEVRSSVGTAIPLSNANFKFLFTDNTAYFFGINGYAGAVSVFATDGTVAGTKLVQELMTGSAWAFAAASYMYTCGDRVYYAGSDYKIGTTVHAGWALSGGDAASGSLAFIDINAGANAQIQDIENFQGKFIYTIGSTTSNKLYAINSCSAAPITTQIQEVEAEQNTRIYPNPSKGNFTIEMKDYPQNSNLEIYNLMGERIYSQRISNSKTDVNPGLTVGVYLIRVVDSKMKSQKLIIAD
ncbi:MAG: T9SS type A sorting domain-containing protein [Paludibacter sp.]|nr:T9SS type A sorting domain-containing protein [Paludibacter sp.]